jgi:hypothetical protein
MGMRETLGRFSRVPVIDAFLLGRAERTVASYPEARRDKMKEFFSAAELRARAADDLFEDPVASLPLFREAGLLYMAALVAVTPDASLNEPLRPAEVVEQFEKLDKARPCPCPKRDLDSFSQLVTGADPMAIDRLPPNEAVERAKSIHAVVGWLRELTEWRTVGQIKVQRYLRVALLVCVVVGTPAWGLNAALTPKNIALHKPTSQSSSFPGASCPPGGLTDGVTSGAYGVHTNKEENPWVQVDLGDLYRIDTVKVYNRGDGWFDEGLPMTLELSENGTDFVEAETRSKSFGDWVPWTAHVGKKKARFVRVRGKKGAYVTLGEIEVFGKK